MDDVPLSIVERFAALEDPRTGNAKRHELLDIIVIALCAVICGADNSVEIEEFGKAREEWFRRFLELPNGIPAHDTFGRVFALLDPEQFAACFTDWVRSRTVPGRGGGNRREDPAGLSRPWPGARRVAHGQRVGQREPDGAGSDPHRGALQRDYRNP